MKEFILKMWSWDDIVTKYLPQLFWFGLKVIGCIVIYAVGRRLIKTLQKVMDKIMKHRELDPSFASFIRSLINIILMVLLIYIIINILGITTTSFLALFASIGVALGMALSGTLQNFAGGVMILLFRPYKVGDYIEAQGQGGTVKEIQIFNTVIITVDNRTIYIPNGGLSTNVIINYSHQNTRRAEWVFAVAYGTDFKHAKHIIEDILKADSRILSNPNPNIVIKTLNDSSVDIQVRAWMNRPDYWDVYYAINEQVYATFNLHGIDIPFPQMTVHLADQNT